MNLGYVHSLWSSDACFSRGSSQASLVFLLKKSQWEITGRWRELTICRLCVYVSDTFLGRGLIAAIRLFREMPSLRMVLILQKGPQWVWHGRMPPIHSDRCSENPVNMRRSFHYLSSFLRADFILITFEFFAYHFSYYFQCFKNIFKSLNYVMFRNCKIAAWFMSSITTSTEIFLFIKK